MSAPTARLSSIMRDTEQQHTRPGTALGSGASERVRERRSVSAASSNATVTARPHSSLSSVSSTSRVPFTPGATSKTSKIAHLGLSAKQVDKLSESIASLQRGPSLSSRNRDAPAVFNKSAPDTVAAESQSKGQTRKGKARASAVPEASFIAETSFVDAPLNSRLVNKAASLAQNEKLTSKRLRQIITKDDDEVDREADLQQLDDGPAAELEDNTLYRDDLGHADLEIQEALLVEDLLGVLVGIEGQFIRIDASIKGDDAGGMYTGPSFTIDEGIDASLRELAYKIVTLAVYYDTVQSFLEDYSHLTFGLTSHALCSGIREFTKEYDVLITHLEEHFEFSPAFSLQKMYYLIQPALHQLFLIYELIQDLTTSPPQADISGEGDTRSDLENDSDDDDDDDDRFGGGKAMKEALKQISGGKPDQGKSLGWSAGGAVKGGEMLAIIDERLQRTSGDPDAYKLYSTLLLKASQPYAQALLRWVNTGHLADPYDEFMIREHRSLHRTALDQDYVDEYWERKYTLKDLSMTSSGADMTSGLESDKMPLNPLVSNTAYDAQNPSLRDTRATKRDKGLGGGAIIPSFLESWKYKILLAGKYLNVIRECGSGDLLEALRDTSQGATACQVKYVGPGEDSDIDMTSEAFQAQLNAAYYTANKACLTLLIDRQSLFARLQSLKHHFFIENGDSFTHFLDLAGYELSKKAKYVSQSKLQSLLDLAIRNPSSASSADPYKEDVKVVTHSTTLTDWLMKINNVDSSLPVGVTDEGGIDQVPDSASAAGDVKEKERSSKKEEKHTLTGIEALALDYAVDFPLSLVLSRRSILRYQLIFRHLLALKHLEQSLTNSWLEHTKNPIWRHKTPHIGLEKWKNRVFTLRCRMLAFVQQMFAFAVSEVLESNWRMLMKRLESVKTVDQLLTYHNDFLDTCCKQCMLTNAKLQKVQSKLMHTCSLFLSYNSRFTKAVHSLTNAVEQAIDQGEDWSTVSIESQNETLSKFEINFYKNQKHHADSVTFHAMSDTGSLLALVVRLSNTMPESEGLPA